MSEDASFQGNAPHKWRIKLVPAVIAVCQVCRLERVCSAFDHDLRGHVCTEDYDLVHNAEDALANAHLEQPTDSILDGGNL